MIHLQKTVPNWLDAVSLLPANSTIILVDEVAQAINIKNANPMVKTSIRHHYDHLQVPNATWPAALKGARDFFSTFIDDTFRFHAKSVDFVQTWNETLANSQNDEERAVWATQERAMCEVWTKEYRSQADYEHIRLCIGNSAVGNWIPNAWAEMYRDYRPAIVIGYHPYTHWKNGVRSDFDWDSLSGLWDHMDFLWRKELGISVEWLFTEAGPFESAVTGWRSSECLGSKNDVSKYVSAVRAWIADCRKTLAYHEGRLHGFGLFTTGKTADQWNSFATEQPELNLLADMVATEWKPGTITPPLPPPEPPPGGVSYKVVVNLLPQDSSRVEKTLVIDDEQVHDNKETILQSADDAARLVAPGKPGSKVKVWDPDRWLPGDIFAWLKEQGVALAEPYSFEDEFRLSVRPLRVLRVTQLFGARPDYYKRFGLPGHDGVDFAAAEGDPVFAAASGIVYYVNHDTAGHNYGLHVRIQHAAGFKTIYAHLSELVVTKLDEGKTISRGALLGYAGRTGNAKGTHLHFGMKQPPGLAGWPADLIDPTPFFEGMIE